MTQQVTPQEQVQSLMVQAMWLFQVAVGLAVAGSVLLFLPKIISKKEKE